MKNFIVSLLILLTIAFQNVSVPQGETAVPFLTVPVSPLLNGIGATGTSLPTDDPFGFLFNPAQLGYISQENNFSFIIYPSSVDISPYSFFQVNISGFALNLGYNFKKLIDFPLTVGFGFARPEINFGEFVFTDEGGPDAQGTFESKDYYLAFSLGAGIDYGVQFYGGITYKNITSILGPSNIGVGTEQGSAEANAGAFDFGFLLNVPVIKLIDDEADLDLFKNVPSIPFFNFSIGYSQLNIGDEIYYIDPAQADPLPRTARLGYGLSTGIDLKVQEMTLRAIELGFTVDAEDLLISGRYDDTTGASANGYQSFLGDIDIGRNIIQMKGDENVISRSGFKFDLVETLTITWGKYSGRSYDNLKTNGIAIRSKGLLKLLDKFTNDPTMSYIAKHFDIRYYNSTYNVDHWSERNFEGIALVINGYQFW
jgi:hypothetical protein